MWLACPKDYKNHSLTKYQKRSLDIYHKRTLTAIRLCSLESHVQSSDTQLLQKQRCGQSKLKTPCTDLNDAIFAPEAHIEKLSMIYIP